MRKSFFFLIIVFIVIGISIFAVNVYLQRSVQDIGDLGTREQDIDQIKSFCKISDFEKVATSSLKREGDEYKLVTVDELEMGDVKTYLQSAKDMCGVLTSSGELEMTQDSENQWSYRFHFSSTSSQAFGLVYFDNQWRFILPQPARL